MLTDGGEDQRGVIALGACLLENASLRSLSLRGNLIDDVGAACSRPRSAAATARCVLDLRDNPFGENDELETELPKIRALLSLNGIFVERVDLGLGDDDDDD